PLVIPDDLSALSDDELAALAGEVTERATQLQDDAVIEEAGAEGVNLIENAIAADEAVSAEQAKREEAAAEQAQILAETRERPGEGHDPPAEREAQDQAAGGAA